MKTLFCILIMYSTFSFAQFPAGKWKSTHGMAHYIYTLDSASQVTAEFIGDLLYTKLSGTYTVSGDTIKIVYNEPSPAEKKVYFRNGTPQLSDTLYVLGNEKLKKHLNPHHLIHLYSKPRDMPVFNYDSSGILNFSVRDFEDTIVLSQSIGFVWKRLQAWTSKDNEYLEIKNYRLPLHSGTNKFRLVAKQPLQSEAIKNFEIISGKKKVKLESTRITDKIVFSAETHYTLYDVRGNTLLEGYAASVDCTALKNGTYYLSFDNEYKDITKK